MEGVKEDEETRRIYSLYIIDFVAKLDKEIYHGDAFESDNFDSIEDVKNLPQLIYLPVENVDLAGDLQQFYACP
jgi:hypothetical protein